MDQQHQAMLKRLGTGELDEQIEQRLGAGVFARDEKSKTGSVTARGSTQPEPTLRPVLRAPTPVPSEAPAAHAETRDDPRLDGMSLASRAEAARRRRRRPE